LYNFVNTSISAFSMMKSRSDFIFLI
jgi:hypothetical protein